jgi:Thiol:disulfide interchange protein DsbD, N-terminal
MRTLRTLLLLVMATPVLAQGGAGRRVPSVTLAPVPITNITRGTPGTVELPFRVSPGFHINSNTPKSEFLIPTTLRLDAPTDIVVGKVTYPRGVDRSFPFAPDEKINVYSGEFTLAVVIRPLAHVVPSRYALHGTLKYQACDNAACYPPKTVPVDFEVKVLKAKVVVHRKNPPQSPHAHY